MDVHTILHLAATAEFWVFAITFVIGVCVLSLKTAAVILASVLEHALPGWCDEWMRGGADGGPPGLDYRRMAIDMKSLARAGAELRLRELLAEAAEIRRAFPGIGGGLTGPVRAADNDEAPRRRSRRHERRTEEGGQRADAQVPGGAPQGGERLSAVTATSGRRRDE